MPLPRKKAPRSPQLAPFRRPRHATADSLGSPQVFAEVDAQLEAARRVHLYAFLLVSFERALRRRLFPKVTLSGASAPLPRALPARTASQFAHLVSALLADERGDPEPPAAPPDPEFDEPHVMGLFGPIPVSQIKKVRRRGRR